jgi:hypothetical protein
MNTTVLAHTTCRWLMPSILGCHQQAALCAVLQEGCSNLAVSVSSTPGSAGTGKESVRKHRELNGEHDTVTKLCALDQDGLQQGPSL